MCFEAAWLMTSTTTGTSAVNVQRLLHRYRDVILDPDRDRLRGAVEVDETFVGGRNKPGRRGRGAADRGIDHAGPVWTQRAPTA
jgi:hypothetical protein